MKIKQLILQWMMSNITSKIKMLKTKLIISFIFVVGISCSSNKEDGYEIKFYIDEKKISIKSPLYEYEEALYVNLNNKDKKSLQNAHVEKIEILIKNELYNALPVKIAFSKKITSSDFIFPVENKTGNIIIETFEGKYYVPLISEKTSIKNMIDDSIITPKHLKFNDIILN
ncbi:hypothetical protein [Mesonia aestuariivivens]|uniref:Lipoprotein n=1 Tax=Mesonia aestuariivivens TaxID=2796128 RepID=A0ABS6W3P1_9FLAO|nr:hypothetical protein [Mesonia aestuariivivens]MBW2962111.1 hypothetical protein [Mesonia aestuariivivens]